MSIKRWVLGKVHGGAQRAGGRHVTPVMHGTAAPEGDGREPKLGAVAGRDGPGAIKHLGPYAPLIGAIREELETFVERQVRMHLAIAERDRYVLSVIEIDCEEHEGSAALLRKFTEEFKPEQVKRYLAREVIAGLRNASAIDLTQFAGLNDVTAALAPGVDDPYKDLIADLQQAPAQATPRAFVVTLVGRWAQGDALAAEGGTDRSRGSAPAARPRGGHTPLAGSTLAVDVEDAGSARRVEIGSVVPGRRYVIGKDPSCDVVVEGTYASRRHCEVWFDRDAWWVADAGSTNGIRVESKGSVVHADPRAQDHVETIEVPAGAQLVLSAFAQGEARDYPRIRLHPVMVAAHGTQATAQAAPATPLAPSRPRGVAFAIDAHMASGSRHVEVEPGTVPVGVGRSRQQALVIDGAHADVSGRHVEVVAVDDGGAWVVVHGDNGVTVEGTAHGPGAKFLWKQGETILLGRADAAVPACTLTLSRLA